MKRDLRKIVNSALIPVIWVVLLWVIHTGIFILGLKNEAVRGFALHTQRLDGLLGILTAPFLHGDWNHLWSNSLPFLVLGTAIIYFYPKSALKVFLISWTLPNLLVWAVVNPSYHIGASGMVFAFAFFLFFSGVFRQERRALILSLLVSFGYGSIVWGVLPLQPGVSWQSHLFGALVGIAMAWLFRKEGDLKKPPKQEEPDLYEPGIPIWDYKSLFPPPEGMKYPEDEV